MINNRVILSGAVFVFFFIIFLAGQASIKNFWSNDDPYYHARHSALINETGNLTLVEPWLSMHFLSFAPTDPWWGYHLAMAFFIHWFGVVWGSKVFSALLAALGFAVFYWILASYKVSKPLAWALVFFGSSSALLARLLLERPHLLTLPVLMLAWYLGSRKKYAWLFILSIVYTLTYHLAPLIMVVIGTEFFVGYLLKRQLDLKLLAAGLGGVLGGILLHPQSLNYVYVMFIEIWQVLYLRFLGVNLNIGNELVTASFSNFLQSYWLPLIFYLPALASFLVFRKNWPAERSRPLWSLGILSFAWFLVALLVPRGAAEYWLPLSWLFSALSWAVVLQTPDGEKIKQHLKKFVTKLTYPFLCLGLSGVLIINVFDLGAAVKMAKATTGPIVEKAKEAAEWLAANTPKGSLIFYNNWSYWPVMFYYNQHNRYLGGMDPTFTYDYNPKLFWLWSNINFYGFVCDQEDLCPRSRPRQAVERVADTIRNQFKAEYALINNKPSMELYKVLAARKQDFVEVFRNDEFLIYRLLTPGPELIPTRTAR